MFHVLLSRGSVCLCMQGFQKEKNGKKNIAGSTEAAKNVEKWFLFKIFFSDKPFLVYKKIIYLSKSIFPGIAGNILEEQEDLIATQDSADHFASHETTESYK